MRNDAQCVVIGGGAMGVGLLYHLAHEGWTDTLLIEKGELTSGSTWHAAGLVPNFIGSLNMAKVHLAATRLYQTLEAETGLSPGWHGCGAIRLAVAEQFRVLRVRVAAGDFGVGRMVMDGLEVLCRNSVGLDAFVGVEMTGDVSNQVFPGRTTRSRPSVRTFSSPRSRQRSPGPQWMWLYAMPPSGKSTRSHRIM